MEAKIQFIRGLSEKVLPDVRLTRSRDGSTGTATFVFKNPNILDKRTTKEGEITGMYLIDEEGILETRNVNAKFVNGKPEAIESIYIMKSPEAWDRFIRFMERYGETNGLVFTTPIPLVSHSFKFTLSNPCCLTTIHLRLGNAS